MNSGICGGVFESFIVYYFYILMALYVKSDADLVVCLHHLLIYFILSDFMTVFICFGNIGTPDLTLIQSYMINI